MSRRSQTRPVADCVVLTPMSATAAQLLHRLLQEAADAVAPAPGTVVLAPQGPPCHHGGDFNHAYAYFDNYDTSTRLARYHDFPTPGWVGNEKRLDSSGRVWERRVHAVIDNFGDLVEVPA